MSKPLFIRVFRRFLDLVMLISILALAEFSLRQNSVQEHLGQPTGWGPITRQVMNARYYATADPPDLIILGSSQAETSINPAVVMQTIREMTGEQISVLNLSTSGAAGYANTRLMIELYSEFHIPPILAVGISPFYMSKPYIAGRWDDITEGALAKAWFADKAYTPLMRWMLLHSRTIEYGNKVTRSILNLSIPSASNLVDEARGFNAVDQQNPDIADLSGQVYIAYGADETDRRSIDDLIRWAQEEGVLLVFFTVPEYTPFIETAPWVFDEMVFDFTNLSNQYPHVFFFDLTTEGRLADEDYYDLRHVNIKGAGEWSRRLATTLVNAQILQRAEVGIIRLYGDNEFAIFQLESQGLLQFWQSGAPSPFLSLSAEQWQIPEQGQRRNFEGDSFRITLEKREAQYYWLSIQTTEGETLRDLPFEAR